MINFNSVQSNPFMRLFIAIFLFFGLGSLVACVITTYYNVSFLSSAKDTNATVVQLDRGRDSEGHVVFYPVFEYVAQEGDTLRYYSEHYSDSFKVGDSTQLLVGEDGSIRESGFVFWIAPFITGIIGLVFGGVGGGFWYTQYLQQKKKEHLLQFGRKINAVVLQLDYNRSIQMNGRSPQVVICEAEISGQKKILRSHNIWEELQLRTGDVVDVYIDPRDQNKYWINVG